MMMNRQQALKRYRIQQLGGIPPEERLLLLYDIALAAANEGESQRLLHALAVLRAGLRYDERPDIVIGLHRLYRYCETAVREREAWGEVAQLLKALRDTWAHALAERDEQAASLVTGDR